MREEKKPGAFNPWDEVPGFFRAEALSRLRESHYLR